MSLRNLRPQRIASTSAHLAVWRQRGVRYYSSQAANDPEWFQQLRAELLSRDPVYGREDVNVLHHQQLLTALAGFTPWTYRKTAVAQTNTPVAHLLTRFNAQVPSAALLPDGTDPLHSPGEPWVRRMWAGGAVELNPGLEERMHVMKLHAKVACIERIKDVRLQGEDDTAKIFVTIERRFAMINRLTDHTGSQSRGLEPETHLMQQVRDGVEWGDAILKEERNLVFLKAKTDTELMAVQAGQTHVPRYLKSPIDPDFTHTLTPTRSLLFRYSALTFNAHLLHLDPAYARNVEGHRNLLVHGPLTLTLMLQTLTRHLWSPEVNAEAEIVESVAYRNLAPLYCDEKMRIRVKRKTRTGAGKAWDVWIEGPEGGMAVKAIMRTVNPRKKALSTKPKVKPTTTTPPLDVQTVAVQAQDSSNALKQQDSSTEQVSQLLHKECQNLQTEEPVTTRSQRKASTRRALHYLYSPSSPLSIRTSPPTQADQSSGSHKTKNTPQQLQLPPRFSLFPSPDKPQQNRKQRRREYQKVRKIEQVTIRKVGITLGSGEKQSKQKMKHFKKALKVATLAAGKREGRRVQVDGEGEGRGKGAE
ncbi:hypothetical protein EKO04_007061 [Ascochyta lentis]|uniref:MaoC-like domain-containing protein n=1 Tax=Ascochyta lentis TaxID=205686 RepID=A0A8H7J1W4_9PLEO|nr:hypothetical protein EKO04_007061 [Ascochyta lentis]